MPVSVSISTTSQPRKRKEVIALTSLATTSAALVQKLGGSAATGPVHSQTVALTSVIFIGIPHWRLIASALAFL
jgi:hypothetical protein